MNRCKRHSRSGIARICGKYLFETRGPGLNLPKPQLTHGQRTPHFWGTSSRRRLLKQFGRLSKATLRHVSGAEHELYLRVIGQNPLQRLQQWHRTREILLAHIDGGKQLARTYVATEALCQYFQIIARLLEIAQGMMGERPNHEELLPASNPGRRKRIDKFDNFREQRVDGLLVIASTGNQRLQVGCARVSHPRFAQKCQILFGLGITIEVEQKRCSNNPRLPETRQDRERLAIGT